MTINDLCEQAKTYILSLDIDNMGHRYTPSAYLTINGAELKSYSHDMTYRNAHKGSTTVYVTKRQVFKTDEAIGDDYLKEVSKQQIINDWESFKNKYILSRLNSNETISITSIILFLYLLRCFLDTRVKVFTDTYHNDFAKLYNTSQDLKYDINTLNPLHINNDDLTLDNTMVYLNIYINQVVNKDTIYVLKSVATTI